MPMAAGTTRPSWRPKYATRGRNLAMALLSGIAGITIIYVLVNLAVLAALGVDVARTSYAPAADVLQRTADPWVNDW